MDYDKAIYWYEKAWQKGSSTAAGNLIQIYLDGKNSELNYEEARKWAEKRIEHADSYFEFYTLANFYEEGIGGPHDFDKAMYWYAKACEYANQNKAKMSAKSFEGAQTLSCDKDKASMGKTSIKAQGTSKAHFDNIVSGAQAGEPEDQLELGRFYERGLGVSRDLQKMHQWFEKSAFQGNSNAQLMLGNAYEEGLGVN